MPSSIALENVNEIAANLYLGGITAALEPQNLVDQGIRAVVCCVRETEFPSCDFHKDLAYYRVDVEDIPREPIDLFWPEATAFMNDWISEGKPVFVHCRAGVSRSASTVIAYLVSYQGYTLNDAFLTARKRRPVVTPNLGFMEKLCDFETTVRGTETTVAFDKYESWYCGSHMAALPEVARAASASTSALSDLASQSSSDKSPGKVQRMKGAVQKVIMVNRLDSLSNTVNKNAVELDMAPPASAPAVLQKRMGTISSMLLRYAAQDPDLGYCQGMHFVAALFVATSESQGVAYWRFHAFMGAVRGMWLPGFALLQTGAAYFQQLAQSTRWSDHLRTHLVEPSMYLPQVWLTFFTVWVPRSTLAECLELLEGNGFAGVLAMTLAILDSASEHLLKQQSMEAVLRALKRLRTLAPAPAALMQGMRGWLPKVGSLLLEPAPRAGAEIACARHGSRVMVPTLLGGPSFDVPVMSVWVADEPSEEPELPKSWREAPRLSCLSWCGSRPSAAKPAAAAKPATAAEKPAAQGSKKRASLSYREQSEELEQLRAYSPATKGRNDAAAAKHAREKAARRRSTLSWAELEH